MIGYFSSIRIFIKASKYLALKEHKITIEADQACFAVVGFIADPSKDVPAAMASDALMPSVLKQQIVEVSPAPRGRFHR